MPHLQLVKVIAPKRCHDDAHASRLRRTRGAGGGSKARHRSGRRRQWVVVRHS